MAEAPSGSSQILESANSFSLPRIRRPALLWEDVNLRYALIHHMKILTAPWTDYNVFERVAIISDIRTTLSNSDVLGKYGDQNQVVTDGVQQLRHTLAEAHRNHLQDLQDVLIKISLSTPPNNASMEVVDQWMWVFTDFLHHTRDYATGANQIEAWYNAFQNLSQRYAKFLARARPSEEIEFVQPPDAPVDRAFLTRSLQGSTSCPTKQTLRDRIGSPKSLQHTFEEITHYYRRWCDDTLRIGPLTIFKDLDWIATTLSKKLAVPQQQLSLSVPKESLITYKAWCHRFSQLWADAALGAIGEKFNDLVAWSGDSADLHLEPFFTIVVGNIKALAPPCPINVETSLWNEYVPSLATPALLYRGYQSLGDLHDDYQRHAYSTEIAQLWLVTWKCLKVLYSAYRSKKFNLPAHGCTVENSFFGRPDIISKFNALGLDIDCQNPRQVEDLVADYCEHVARCRNSTHRRFSQLRLFRESPVHRHVLDCLAQFVQEQQLELKYLHSLHRVVIRLNSLNGGPAVIRRWESARGPATWKVIIRDIGSDARDQVDAIPATLDVDAAHDGDNTLLQVSNNQQVPQDIDSHMQGFDIESAFDFVYYPHPETRANEVAMSHKITRDLGSTGFRDRSVQLQHIVNRPPRHALPPRKVSSWKGPSGYGPLGRLLRLTGRLILATTRKTNNRRVVRPGITSRDILSPVRTARNRVNKPRPAFVVPKLRGGGQQQSLPIANGTDHAVNGNGDQDRQQNHPVANGTDHAVNEFHDHDHDHDHQQNYVLVNGVNNLPNGVDGFDTIPGADGINHLLRPSMPVANGVPVPNGDRRNSGSSGYPSQRGASFSIFQDSPSNPQNRPTSNSRSISPTTQVPPRQQRPPNGTGRGIPISPVNGSSTRSQSSVPSVSVDSNIENRTPTQPRGPGPCHPCPQFAGQYHHSCIACPGHGQPPLGTFLRNPHHPRGNIDPFGRDDGMLRRPAIDMGTPNMDAQLDHQLPDGPHADHITDGLQAPPGNIDDIDPQHAGVRRFLGLALQGASAMIRTNPHNLNTVVQNLAQSLQVANNVLGRNQPDQTVPAVPTNSPAMDPAQPPSPPPPPPAVPGAVQVPATPAPPAATAPPALPAVNYVPPTQNDYGLLFADEMRSELVHRGLLAGTLPNVRSGLIMLLTAEDANGNFGRGNRAGYRVITNNPHARVRPRNYVYPHVNDVVPVANAPAGQYGAQPAAAQQGQPVELVPATQQ